MSELCTAPHCMLSCYVQMACCTSTRESSACITSSCSAATHYHLQKMLTALPVKGVSQLISVVLQHFSWLYLICHRLMQACS